MFRRSVVIAALSAVALVALGAETVTHLGEAGASEPNPRAAITRAVRAPYEAFLHRDSAALCAAFTPTAASHLVAGAPAGSSCDSAVSEVFAETAPYQPPVPAPLPASFKVTRIVAHGSSATAEVTYGKGGGAHFSLQKIANAWLVSNRSRLVTVKGCGGTARATPCPANARVVYFFIAPLAASGPPLTPIPPAIKRAGGRTLSDFKAGRVVYAQTGCAACHRIGDQGNTQPGPNLTHVGARLSSSQITKALVDATEPMPSFNRLPSAKFKAIVEFLSLLR